MQSADDSSQCSSPLVTRARLYVSLFACTKEALCPIAPLIVQLRCCDTGAVVGGLLKTSHFSAHDPGMGTNRFVSYSEMSLMDVLHHVSTHVLSDYYRPTTKLPSTSSLNLHFLFDEAVRANLIILTASLTACFVEPSSGHMS